jgi:hypothetical protein
MCWNEQVTSNDGKDTVCNLVHNEMRWCGTWWDNSLSSPRCPECILHISQSMSPTPESNYTRCCPVRFHHSCIPVHPASLSPLPSWVVLVVRYRFSCHNSCMAHCANDSSPRPLDMTLYPNLTECKNDIYPNPKEHKNNKNLMERHKHRLKGKPWFQWKNIKILTPCALAFFCLPPCLPSIVLNHLWCMRCCEAEDRIELSLHAWHIWWQWYRLIPLYTT